jgi:anti-sigma B factor antagonist
MNIGFRIEGEVAIVRLEGRFNTGSDAEYTRVKEGLRESGKDKVMVDCADVPYLDSTALNFLIGLYTAVVNAGGRFALCGLNARVREVLRITHLDKIIPTYDTRESAMATLTQAGERAVEG